VKHAPCVAFYRPRPRVYRERYLLNPTPMIDTTRPRPDCFTSLPLSSVFSFPLDHRRGSPPGPLDSAADFGVASPGLSSWGPAGIISPRPRRLRHPRPAAVPFSQKLPAPLPSFAGSEGLRRSLPADVSTETSLSLKRPRFKAALIMLSTILYSFSFPLALRLISDPHRPSKVVMDPFLLLLFSVRHRNGPT